MYICIYVYMYICIYVYMYIYVSTFEASLREQRSGRRASPLFALSNPYSRVQLGTVENQSF